MWKSAGAAACVAALSSVAPAGDLPRVSRQRPRWPKRFAVKIRAGYEISYDCPQPTPMIPTLSVYPSRTSDC
jgi:hypothetical protein